MSNRARTPRDPPKDGKISRGGSAPPDPPGLRLRAEGPMANAQAGELPDNAGELPDNAGEHPEIAGEHPEIAGELVYHEMT